MDVMDPSEEQITTQLPTSSDKKSIIFGVVGVLGLIFGVTGIIMANSAKKELDSFRAEITARPDKTAVFEERIVKIEEKLDRNAKTDVNFDRAIRDLKKLPSRTELTKTFNDVASQIKDNREQINKIADAIKKVNSRGSSKATYTTTKKETPKASKSTETPTEEGIYIIQPNDMLGKIATKFNTTVDKILQANPGINPRRLQIGQRILIPSE